MAGAGVQAVQLTKMDCLKQWVLLGSMELCRGPLYMTAYRVSVLYKLSLTSQSMSLILKGDLYATSHSVATLTVSTRNIKELVLDILLGNSGRQ